MAIASNTQYGLQVRTRSRAANPRAPGLSFMLLTEHVHAMEAAVGLTPNRARGLPLQVRMSFQF